jgi:subtilisin family serine protease
VAAGITVAVAAGNEGNNACNSSPARTPGAITVGATSRTDARPTWSNYGSCLDLFAPGQDVVSAGIGSDTATDTMWGTSMATPHVAGLAALLLQENPARKPSEVAAAIKANAGIGMLKSIGSGSPNLLLYSAFLSSPVTVVEPVVTQPVVTEPVVAAPASQYMAVAALAGSSVAAGRRYWQGRVTVAVKDEHEQMVAGVVVKGGFSAGGSSMSCTTASNGTCVITSGRLGLSTSSTTFTIASLAKTGVTYMPAYNSAGSVTILAP